MCAARPTCITKLTFTTKTLQYAVINKISAYTSAEREKGAPKQQVEKVDLIPVPAPIFLLKPPTPL